MPAPRKVSDKEILTVLNRSEDRILTTSEIAEEVPISRRAVLDRLNNLQDEGRIKKKQVGGRNVVWYPNWSYWMDAR